MIYSRSFHISDENRVQKNETGWVRNGDLNVEQDCGRPSSPILPEIWALVGDVLKRRPFNFEISTIVSWRSVTIAPPENGQIEKHESGCFP